MDLIFDMVINTKKPLTAEINQGIIAMAQKKFKLKVIFGDEDIFKNMSPNGKNSVLYLDDDELN